MHILFLTDNFPPEVNAPASRTFEHCRLWAQAGHRVTVITGAPNFPQGRVYEGHRNALFQREQMAGIDVIRVWTYIAPNEGFLKRTLDYQSFMAAATAASVVVRDVDIVVGTSPQFFTAVAAFLVSRQKRIPWVFELRDLWPESIKAVGAMEDSLVIRGLEALEGFLYRKASAVVSVTHAFKRTLVERGVPADKIVVITNGVDRTRFTPRPKDPELVAELGLEGRFVVGYIGTHGMAHALETVLDAAERLRDVPRIAFLLLGDGARKAELERRAAERGLQHVIFRSTVPKDEVPRYWSVLDLSLIHLKRTPLFETVIPSKLFEGMGMERPVLLGVAGESAGIVEKTGVGVCFEPENADDLCDKLLALVNDPARLETLGQQCRVAAGRYDRARLAEQMLGTLRGLVA